MDINAFASLSENLPELARYGGEPAQMVSGSHGKCGFLDLRFDLDPDHDRSRLVDLDRRAPFLVQKALYWDEELPGLPCVMIITTSGCLLQGDRMELRIVVDEGAMAHVTTQSATKIHMMEANYALQIQRIEVAPGGYLEYLPDPVIPHRSSRYAVDTELTVAESGMAVFGEVLQPGRLHHHAGERFGFDLYAALLRIRRPGAERPLFAERMVLEPAFTDVDANGVMNGFDALASAVLVAPPETTRRARAAVLSMASPEIMSGASLLPGDCGLMFRAVARTTELAVSEMRRFWAACRQACVGKGVGKEFLWK